MVLITCVVYEFEFTRPMHAPIIKRVRNNSCLKYYYLPVDRIFKRNFNRSKFNTFVCIGTTIRLSRKVSLCVDLYVSKVFILTFCCEFKIGHRSRRYIFSDVLEVDQTMLRQQVKMG